MNTLQHFFTFQLAENWLALEPDAIVTILDPQQFIPFPLAPSHILGLIPHGQSILPVFHLAYFLKMSNADDEDPTQKRLLVLRKNTLEVVVPIQTTGGMKAIPKESIITSSLVTKNGRLQDFLVGEYESERHVTGILDIGLILERARV